MIGSTISHYRVLEELGHGGMGIVYRAEDLRLGREVALKVLPADLADQPEALDQLHREARLASALNHPYICTIHDVGTDAGRPFIVMELLYGDTLKARLNGRPMPVDHVLDLAIQIGEALSVAHQRGIVHRDLKPANIFITRDDHVKILDFGLAKVLRGTDRQTDVDSSAPTASRRSEALTSTGTAGGTTAYMSPEQARGESVTGRSDLFALGAVIYEMVTGARAFPGGTPALVFDGILNRNPARPSQLNASVPSELERVIEKALEKDPDLRYQDAPDLVSDLRRLRRRLGSSGEGEPSAARGPDDPAATWWRPRRVTRAALVGALALVAAATVLVWLSLTRPGAPPLTERDSVLLASFFNSTGDAVFDDTLRQGLAVQLAQSPFLDLVPPERIDETLRLMGRSREGVLPHTVAREVCQRLDVKAMIEGRLALIGSLYVVTVEATNCQTGEAIAREQTQVGSKEEVLQGLGRITSAIRQSLGESLASIERFDVPIEQATTPSLDALRAYTLGVARRGAGSDVEAIPFFTRAIELDPNFASAYSMLSTIYGNLGESLRSREYARLAFERGASVSERERLLIAFQYHDRITEDQLKVIEVLDVWKQSFPRDYRPSNALCLIFNRLGLYERAIEEGLEAMRRNPSHPFPYSNLAYAHRGTGQYDDARRVAEQAVALGIETPPTRRLLFQLAVLRNDPGAADEHLRWAAGRPQEFDFVGARAQIAAFGGRMTEARELFRQAVGMADGRGLAETATGYQSLAIWTEALYGNHEDAVRMGRGLLAKNLSAAPLLRVTASLGLAGNGDEAGRLLAEQIKAHPTAMLVQRVYAPIAAGALALGGRRPDEALEALRPALLYELGNVAALAPVYLRGRAYLMKGALPEAAAEFTRLLEHRGVDPFSPLYPLAQLGRAQALGRRDPAEARASYDAFFALWAGADADVPVLREARTAYARLGGAN